MSPIQKRTLLDEDDRPVAVQLDLATFEKMEALLEDYGLMQWMNEKTEEAPLGLEEARAYYAELSKAS